LPIKVPSRISAKPSQGSVLAAATRSQPRVQPATLRRQFGQCVHGRTSFELHQVAISPKVPTEAARTHWFL